MGQILRFPVLHDAGPRSFAAFSVGPHAGRVPLGTFATREFAQVVAGRWARAGLESGTGLRIVVSPVFPEGPTERTARRAS